MMIYFYTKVGNLVYASPATVSRAGMVYVDPKNLGYEPYWKRWIRTRKPDEGQSLNVRSFYNVFFLRGSCEY